MQTKNLWNLYPNVHVYLYIAHKNQFMLEEDCYDDWSMFLVEDGIFEFQMGEKKDVAKPGEIVLCPPGVPVRRRMVTPLSFHFIRFDWQSAQRPPLPYGKLKITNQKRLFSTFAELRRSAQTESRLSSELRNHLLYDIWLLYCFERFSPRPLDRFLTGDPLLTEALAYIHAHVYEKMNLKELAQCLGLTSVQLERRFKSEFAIPPKDYVTALRLAKAKSLLLNTAMTLAEIAAHSGYGNEYYFSNVFKKHFQISPSKYRVRRRL